MVISVIDWWLFAQPPASSLRPQPLSNVASLPSRVGGPSHSLSKILVDFLLLILEASEPQEQFGKLRGFGVASKHCIEA